MSLYRVGIDLSDTAVHGFSIVEADLTSVSDWTGLASVKIRRARFDSEASDGTASNSSGHWGGRVLDGGAFVARLPHSLHTPVTRSLRV